MFVIKVQGRAYFIQRPSTEPDDVEKKNQFSLETDAKNNHQSSITYIFRGVIFINFSKLKPRQHTNNFKIQGQNLIFLKKVIFWGQKYYFS